MTNKTFTLTNPDTGTSTDLPLVEGTSGSPGLDVRGVNRDHGVFTYDPAFTATCSCDSAITYIDGANSLLTYRGYPIEQLAEQSSFMEVCYLLLNGELPASDELEVFTNAISREAMINESLYNGFDGFQRNAHPMAMLTSLVGTLSSIHHDSTDIQDPEQRTAFAHRMMAKIPTIAAAAYKHSVGEPRMYPRSELGYADNLLHMLFAKPSERYEVDPVAAKALDTLLILHADHEQNASTSTVRMVGSTDCNPYAAISAGIAALWGPAHGGANEAVLSMLGEIGDASQVPKYLEKAKDKNDPFRLMGFGHRVYKNYDPRATVIRGHCHEVLKHYGMENNKLFELAMELERIALEDDYFAERKLYPNVDFYSGIIYQALGIPVSMFTPMFAIARTAGWVSHWCEMQADPAMRIARPRQVYTGSVQREYKTMGQR